MKRRNFLKLVATAVVCPKGLLKAEPVTKSVVLTQHTLLSGKKFATFHANGGDLTDGEREELIKKMQNTFKNTKFKSPLHLKCIYYHGVPCFYQSKFND